MHGDLVFKNEVFNRVVVSPFSYVTIPSTFPLPEKDFKAKVVDSMVMRVGVNIFNEAVEVQTINKLLNDDWKMWLDKTFGL